MNLFYSAYLILLNLLNLYNSFDYKIYLFLGIIIFILLLYFKKMFSLRRNAKNKQKLNSLFNNNLIKQDFISEKNYKNKSKKKYKKKNNVNKKTLEKLQNSPKNVSIINYKLSELPPNIIQFISQNDFKLNNNKICALSAYLISKGLFIKIFRDEQNTTDLITDFNSFVLVYKRYIELKPENTLGYNFCLKFYNSYKTPDDNYINNIYDNFDYVHLKNNNIIKINKFEPYFYIERRLEVNNLFLMKKNSEVVVSYGSYIIIDINPDIINSFFNNSNDYSQIYKYHRYNKLKIIYWVSVFT